MQQESADATALLQLPAERMFRIYLGYERERLILAYLGYRVGRYKFNLLSILSVCQTVG